MGLIKLLYNDAIKASSIRNMEKCVKVPAKRKVKLWGLKWIYQSVGVCYSIFINKMLHECSNKMWVTDMKARSWELKEMEIWSKNTQTMGMSCDVLLQMWESLKYLVWNNFFFIFDKWSPNYYCWEIHYLQLDNRSNPQIDI